MKTIGITGGVGAGKSEILKYIGENCKCRIILSDRLAEQLQQPGNICYEPLISLLGNGIIDTPGGPINRPAVAKLIFNDKTLLQKVNEIVHPAVHDAVMKAIETERVNGITEYFFLESAILIEAGYKQYMDELWYIYADTQTRINRLIKARGYSREKAEGIIKAQKPDSFFRDNSDVIIDNSGNLEETKTAIDKVLKN